MSPRHPWLQVAGIALPSIACVTILIVGLLLLVGICGMCASILPSMLILVAAGGWATVVILRVLGLRSSCLYLSAFLTIAHGTLMAILSSQVCVVCVGVLTLELLSCIVAIPGSKLLMAPHPTGVLACCIVGCSSSYGYVKLALPVMPSREITAKSRRANDTDLIVYVVVRRNCGNCEQAEKRLAEEIERGLACRAVILDERSDTGSHLVKTHSLEILPAFLAVRKGAIVAVQDGGSVERFLTATGRESRSQ